MAVKQSRAPRRTNKRSLGELGELGALASFEKMHHVDTSSLALEAYFRLHSDREV